MPVGKMWADYIPVNIDLGAKNNSRHGARAWHSSAGDD